MSTSKNSNNATAIVAFASIILGTRGEADPDAADKLLAEPHIEAIIADSGIDVPEGAAGYDQIPAEPDAADIDALLVATAKEVLGVLEPSALA